MTAMAISPQVTVPLPGGAGQCSLTPPSGTMWQLSLAAVSTTSAVAASQAFLYLGSASGPLTLIDSTFLGNSASSGKVAGTPLYHGTYLWATWTGADPGSLATLQAYGTQVTRYRAAQ
jgi:hypothetical protein